MLRHKRDTLENKRQGTKRKQGQQEDSILIKSGRRYKKAVVGY